MKEFTSILNSNSSLRRQAGNGTEGKQQHYFTQRRVLSSLIVPNSSFNRSSGQETGREILKKSTMTHTRKIILPLCLNALLFATQVAAFSSPTKVQRTMTSPINMRTLPLNAFEVTATVEAVEASGAAAITSINAFFQTQPYLAAFLTCSFKASAADIVAQTREDSGEPETVLEPVETASNRLDVARNLGFLLYGGLYQGMVQNYLYNNIYPTLVGSDDSWFVIFKEVLLDNLVFAPLLCLPIAYMFKAAFTSDNLSLDTFQKGLQKYFDDATKQGLLTKYWAIWIPAQCLTFGVVPPHFRVAFVATISFFWIFILSTIASAETITTGEKSL